MGIAEIAAIILGATRLAAAAADIIERMTKEGRTAPTAAEMARLRAEQAEADEGWAAQLAKLRNT